MEESFHESQRLTKQKLVDLMQKSDHPATGRFTIMMTFLLASATCVIVSWNGPLWQIIISQLFFGMVTCSLFACLHEAAHNTAFKSRMLNQIAAEICGIASLYPAAIFREFHFQHHRYTHIPGKDPEISLGNKPIPGVLSSLPVYFAWLSGLPFIFFKCFMILGGCLGVPEILRTNFFPFIRKDKKIQVIADSWITAVFYIIIYLLAWLVNPGFYGIFTGMVAGQCILSAYLLPEHNGLPHEGSIFDRTRSMKTSSFMRMLMWNMPYHAEHHAYPAIPFHALPALHNFLGEEISHKSDGYPDFHLKVLGRQIQ